jgi:Ca2+-binding RTX toxin-like protein
MFGLHSTSIDGAAARAKLMLNVDMPLIDHLESRMLLTFIGVRDAGTLLIEGTAGDDIIIVDAAPAPLTFRIRINGDPPVDFPFSYHHGRSSIYGVSVRGFEGNDVIRFNGPLNLQNEADCSGGPGDDLIISAADRTACLGDEGNDTLQASGSDRVSFLGGSGKDVLSSTGAADVDAYGGSGNDLISTAGGNDSISGGPGSDTITAGAGDDLILGGRGNDSLTGEDGDDWLFGQQANDTLSGGNGNDHLFGQGGNDLVYGAAGNDTLFSGTGVDTLDSTAGELTHLREYRRIPRLINRLLGANRLT